MTEVISVDDEKEIVTKKFLVPKKLDGFREEIRTYLPIKYNHLVDGETFKMMLSECKNKFGDYFAILKNPNQTYVYDEKFSEINNFISKFYKMDTSSIEEQISEELDKKHE